jgi:hypothetical protein
MPNDLAYVKLFPRCPGLVLSLEAYRSRACTVSFDEGTAADGVRSHVQELNIVGAADMARKLPIATGSTCESFSVWPASW